jgi:alpha-tubulin suppressor-like RCC1 family protein
MGYVALYPKIVDDLLATKICQVACGEAHTIVLDNKGDVYSFGWGEDGQLGLTNSDLHNGVMSAGVRRIDTLSDVTKVGCGSIYTTFLTR